MSSRKSVQFILLVEKMSGRKNVLSKKCLVEKMSVEKMSVEKMSVEKTSGHVIAYSSTIFDQSKCF